MPIKNDKSSLLDEISTLKTLSQGFPKLKKFLNFPSLNNSANPLDFLLDLIKTLVGFDEFKNETIRFLTYQVIPIEAQLKSFLKSLLKSLFSCNTDALIPNDLFNVGVNISIKQIDFFDMLKIDPLSDTGSMTYGSLQEDLNHVIYDSIQNGISTWKDLLEITFSTFGIVDGEQTNNVFTIKIDSFYEGKTINDFINDFIDKIQIITLPFLINRIFDNMFGVISMNSNRSKESIQREEELFSLVDKVIDLPDLLINDSYFEFDEKDLSNITEKSNSRYNGIRNLMDCNNFESKIEIEDLLALNEELQSPILIEIEKTITNRFEIIAINSLNGVEEINKDRGLLNFYFSFFKGIIYGIFNLLLSPKLILFFSVYYKIVSNSVGFTNFKEFLTVNKAFIEKIVIDFLLPLLIKFLLKIIIRELTKLIAKDQIERQKERYSNFQKQLLSLLGISDDILKLL